MSKDKLRRLAEIKNKDIRIQGEKADNDEATQNQSLLAG